MTFHLDHGIQSKTEGNPAEVTTSKKPRPKDMDLYFNRKTKHSLGFWNEIKNQSDSSWFLICKEERIQDQVIIMTRLQNQNKLLKINTLHFFQFYTPKVSYQISF